MAVTHRTVMKKEAVDALQFRPDAVVVDATLGSGGHAREILTRLEKGGRLIAFDADKSAVAAAKETLSGEASIDLVCGNFRDIDTLLDGLTVRTVDAILADLGWRTEQFTQSGRGFSFDADEPLLMTYGEPENYPFTAATIVNEWSEESLANVLKGYGEERSARRIARAIADFRGKKPVATAKELANIVRDAIPARPWQKIDPATRTFQALRIAVNDELRTLEEFIPAAVARLAPNGRLVIITFHSLEDRIVKHTFRSLAAEGGGTVITKKPVVPSEVDIAENPRARSAKLRIFQKHF